MARMCLRSVGNNVMHITQDRTGHFWGSNRLVRWRDATGSRNLASNQNIHVRGWSRYLGGTK
jgi:hypothetical protein